MQYKITASYGRFVADSTQTLADISAELSAALAATPVRMASLGNVLVSPSTVYAVEAMDQVVPDIGTL